MKIRIELTVDVDPKVWAEYNNAQTAAEVRQDVKDYVLYSVQGAPSIEEADAEVTIR